MEPEPRMTYAEVARRLHLTECQVRSAELSGLRKLKFCQELQQFKDYVTEYKENIYDKIQED